MPLNDAVPSSARDVATRNMQDLDKFLNGEQLTNNNRIGAAVRSIAGIQSEVNSAFSGLGYVPVSGSFESGGTVTERNEILLYEADGYYYKWAGTLPKVVAPASTPATAGGVGVGAWSLVGGVGDSVVPFGTVADADAAPLRIGQLVFTGGYDYVGDEGSNLYIVVAAATGTDDGGSFIDMSASGYQLKGLFPFGISVQQWGAHRITELGYSSFDSQPAFDAAIQYCAANGIPTLKYKGQYNIINAPYTFTTPGDDGTVYPPWVGAGDANLAAETVFNIPVCLFIPEGVSLICDDLEYDRLIGDYNTSSGLIDTNQKICIMHSAGSVYSDTVRYTLRVNLRNWFIGRVVEGIQESSVYSIYYQNCMIPALIHGSERTTIAKVRLNECYAPEVFGGWWTQRNDSKQDSTYYPPYPGAGAMPIGWNDFLKYDVIEQAATVDYGTRAADLDSFFDTYFFKDSNSARTSSGGRLSNNSAPVPAIMTPYRGICGRASCILSRYGRIQNTIEINRLKTYGCYRTPVYLTPGIGFLDNAVNYAFIENTGLIAQDGGTSGNLFGIDNTDPYRSASYGIGYQVAENMAVYNFTLQGATNQRAPICDRGEIFYETGIRVNRRYESGAPTTPPDAFIKYVRLDDLSPTTIYEADESRFFTKPIRFGTDPDTGDLFEYEPAITGWTPTFKVGGVEQAITTKQASIRKMGDIYEISCLLNDATVTVLGAGAITIEGLPVSADITSKYLVLLHVQNVNGLTAGINVSGYIAPGASIIQLMKDSANTPLDGGDLPSMTQLNFYISGIIRNVPV